jgi:hypothetical protein
VLWCVCVCVSHWGAGVTDTCCFRAAAATIAPEADNAAAARGILGVLEMDAFAMTPHRLLCMRAEGDGPDTRRLGGPGGDSLPGAHGGSLRRRGSSDRHDAAGYGGGDGASPRGADATWVPSPRIAVTTWRDPSAGGNERQPTARAMPRADDEYMWMLMSRAYTSSPDSAGDASAPPEGPAEQAHGPHRFVPAHMIGLRDPAVESATTHHSTVASGALLVGSLSRVDASLAGASQRPAPLRGRSTSHACIIS